MFYSSSKIFPFIFCGCLCQHWWWALWSVWHFVEILLTGMEFFHVVMQRDRQTDTTRIAVAFRKFFCKRASDLFLVSHFADLHSCNTALYQNTTEHSFPTLITHTDFRPHLATCQQSLMIIYISIPNERRLFYCSFQHTTLLADSFWLKKITTDPHILGDVWWKVKL
jgi:hypothetical protein